MSKPGKVSEVDKHYSNSDSDNDNDSNTADAADDEKNVYEEPSINDCESCGMEIHRCEHGSFCFCDPLCFRGFCLLCLFNGDKYGDNWDSLDEVLDGIALKAIRIGYLYSKQNIEKPNPPKKNIGDPKTIMALYKLFIIGFENKFKK